MIARSKIGYIATALALGLVLLLAVVSAVPRDAAAASTFEALAAPSIADNGVREFGAVVVKVTAGSIPANATHYLFLRLPTDFEFRDDWSVVFAPSAPGADDLNYVYVPQRYAGEDNGLADATIGFTPIADNEIRISVTAGTYLQENDGYFYIYQRSVWVPDGFSGPVEVDFTSPSSHGFTPAKVTVAKVNPGLVSLSVDEVDTSADTFTVTLRFKEMVGGSFESDRESIKLRLPAGFEWVDVDNQQTLWGDSAWVDNLVANMGTNNTPRFVVDGRDLIINTANGAVPARATYFRVDCTFRVEDEGTAKKGDVSIDISGATDTAPATLLVGRYAEHGAAVSVKGDIPEVNAGKIEQKIADFVIEETVPGSLSTDRTITLTLPAYAKWGRLPKLTEENGLDITFTGFPGRDGRTARYEVDTASTTDAGKITFEDAEVILAPDATGDLVIEVGGTAGVSGKITVAKVKPSVSATAASVPTVIIGAKGQKVADFELNEGIKEAMEQDRDLVIVAPAGVQFTRVPNVSVSEGDLTLDTGNIRLRNNDTELVIPIDGESTKPSKIKISDVYLDLDRTVPEGDLVLKVRGNAVVEVNDTDQLDQYYGVAVNSYYQLGGRDCFRFREDGAFPGVEDVALVTVAKCVTPAPPEQKATAVFKIGDTKFTVNGKEQTMDVAPYIKDGRTFLPVRYVAQALGVSESNILWNAADQTVVLMRGDRVVKLQIGSTTMYINGVTFTMDVAPELVEPGRTMLPFRWVAQALGASVEWDPATESVTMTL